MSDFHLDAFIDDLARALLLARRDCNEQWQARRRAAADQAATIAGLPLTWQQVVPPSGIGSLDLELLLHCELALRPASGQGVSSLALRVCTPPQGHRLLIALGGDVPLRVRVSLDGNVLRDMYWSSLSVVEGTADG